MSNQDIIYRLWLKYKMPLIDVSLNGIEDFAKKHKHEFNANPRNKDSNANPDSIVSLSGFNYAIREFIIKYCTSVGWDKNELKSTNYSIWTKYRGKKVNLIADNSLSTLDENNDAIERYDKELEKKSIK